MPLKNAVYYAAMALSFAAMLLLMHPSLFNVQ